MRLPLRCVPSPYSAEARGLERAWLEEGLDRRTRRERMERHNLGRARVAAQARERHPDWGRVAGAPHYRDVPVDRQRAEGAYTMGQGATVSDRIGTVADVAPLTGVNRALVRQGLQIMRARNRPGLAALADVAGDPSS